MENPLKSLTPKKLQKQYDEAYQQMVQNNAITISSKIASKLTSSHQGFPLWVCLDDVNCTTDESPPPIYPENLEYLLSNGFNVYKVVFIKPKCYRHYITWDKTVFKNDILPSIMNTYGYLLKDDIDWITL